MIKNDIHNYSNSSKKYYTNTIEFFFNFEKHDCFKNVFENYSKK